MLLSGRITSMKLIIGLGNPGEKYQNNRHNVGHMVIESLLKKGLSKGIVVKKIGVYMNESGDFVNKLVEQYRVDTSDLWIIHDDLDIKLGDYKIQKGRGPKEHRGLLSIYEKLGTRDFWHVRIGVDNRDLEEKIPGDEYVLEDFSYEEKEIINQVISKITQDLYERVLKS